LTEPAVGKHWTMRQLRVRFTIPRIRLAVAGTTLVLGFLTVGLRWLLYPRVNLTIPNDRSTTMDRPHFEIITTSLVDWLRNEGFPLPQPPIRYYPDGSLWTDDHRVLQWKHESGAILAVQQLIHYRLPGAYAACCFRPLAPFGGDSPLAPSYTVTYPGSCDWMGEGELGALMYPGISKAASADEYDLAHVRVRINLRSEYTQGVAEELAGVVRRWLADMGSHGVFGEAGVKSISPTMCYLGRDAGFVLDGRGSGQETLNTLYLAVLNWGMHRRRPLCLIDFSADRNEAVFASDLSVLLR
jgi:hypothetical protein